MKDVLKRVLPKALQRAIYRLLWNPVRDAYWRFLRLKCVLPSGLVVEVTNRSDWTICSEVLVAGEYDTAIELALKRRKPNELFTVADFGANVGYFTLRCADRFFQQPHEHNFLEMLLIEGSPIVFRDLQRRVAAQPLLRDRVKLRLGLVGQRAGEAYIGDSHIHYGNTVSSERTSGAMRVAYLDLDKEFAEVEKISLMKCDIEGAEFDLIKNFQGFLGKVDTVVFEFHPYGRSLSEAHQTLESYGFKNRLVLRDGSALTVELYWR